MLLLVRFRNEFTLNNVFIYAKFFSLKLKNLDIPNQDFLNAAQSGAIAKNLDHEVNYLIARKDLILQKGFYHGSKKMFTYSPNCMIHRLENT